MKCVLIIDDDPDIRELLSILLGSSGYETVSAREGGEALDRLREGLVPDVILLDLMMPGMNGWEFQKELRSDKKLAAIPVIVITGDTMVPKRAAEVGAAGFLRKPFGAVELLELLARF